MDAQTVDNMISSAVWDEMNPEYPTWGVCSTFPGFRFQYWQPAETGYLLTVWTSLLPDEFKNDLEDDGDFRRYGHMEDSFHQSNRDAMLRKFLLAITSMDLDGLKTFDHESLWGSYIDDDDGHVESNDEVPDDDGLTWGPLRSNETIAKFS